MLAQWQAGRWAGVYAQIDFSLTSVQHNTSVSAVHAARHGQLAASTRVSPVVHAIEQSIQVELGCACAYYVHLCTRASVSKHLLVHLFVRVRVRTRAT
jgi:hypothetical protein